MKIAKKHLSASSGDTFDIGKEMGQSLRGGEIIALYGDLGAGKTAFTQGLARGLGIKERVNSPTFVIIKIYQSKKNKLALCHIDAYRLVSENDLLAIGLEDYLNNPKIITVIEWAEKVDKILPSNTIKISIKNISATKREIIIQSYEI